MRRLFIRIIREHTVDKKTLQKVQNRLFFKYYQSGITLSMQNKLEEANEQFNRCLDEIKNNKEQVLEHYSFILRRIAHNHVRMGQMTVAEEKLYRIIKNKRELEGNVITLYDDYDRLYRHMISYDLEKAAKLCKALLLAQKQNMPNSYYKLFQFNLGNTYLLLGNYNDAKEKYQRCLQSDPQGKLKSYLYNNLGLACWWHKNPLQQIRDESQLTNKQNIQKQFKQTKELFAKSISVAQLLTTGQNETKQLLMKQTLDFRQGILHEKLEFEANESLFPVYNIGEYYIQNDPLQKLQILYWMHKALALSKKLKNTKVFDRIYVEYGLLSHNIEQLIKKLPELVQKYRYSQQFEEQSYYCYIYARLQKQKDDILSDEYLSRAHTIKNILPSWSFKLKYLAIDSLDLCN